MDQDESKTWNRVNTVRRSRADRARIEIERRHRSLSRGSDASNTSRRSKTSNSNAANKVATAGNISARSSQSSVKQSDQNSRNATSNNEVSDTSLGSITTSSRPPSPIRSRLEVYEKKGIRVSKKEFHEQQGQHGYQKSVSEISHSQTQQKPAEKKTISIDPNPSQRIVAQQSHQEPHQPYPREEHQLYARQMQQKQELKRQVVKQAVPVRGQAEQHQTYQLAEPQKNSKIDSASKETGPSEHKIRIISWFQWWGNFY